jgi:primosomal protein N'
MADTKKDYKKAIEGVGEMTIEQLHDLYSQMLATAHDIGYKVPDDLLVETEDAEVLRGVIPPLNEGIEKHAAEHDQPDGEKTTTAKEPEAAAPKKRAAKKAAAANPKAAKAAASTESNVESTAKKTTAKKAAKKGVAKGTAKKGASKAAKANARTPVARSKWSEKATIKVLTKDKENPTRKGTGRHDRVANLIKHDGKLVSEYLKKGGKTGTLSYSIEQGWVKVVG